MLRGKLTSVYNIIFMAIFQGAANLAGKLPRDTFPKASMAYDVIKHLAAAHVFEDHIVVMLVNDHLSHATDVRVVKEHAERGLPNSPHLLGVILGRLLGEK